ncbi:TPA: hypothetical protein RG647_RS17030 [Providencia rettgeri]|nr:hypothetical protein [Providencia rettgeri]
MREVKPTQKPVPSSDIKDLFFNSGLLDIWATSLEHKYIDRFGNCHLTAAGMEWIFNELVTRLKIESEQALLAAGYAPAGTFQEGAEVVSRNGTVLWKLPDGDGDHYRWDGDLPKQVPVGSTPESTGGIGKGAWVSVGDASLRGNLRAGDGLSFIGETNYEGVRNYTGSNSKIGVYGINSVFDGGNGEFVLDKFDTKSEDNGGTILIDSLNRRWKRIYDGELNGLWFGMDRSGVNNSSDAFNRIINAANLHGEIKIPSGVYLLSGNHSLKKNQRVTFDNVEFKSDGTASQNEIITINEDGVKLLGSLTINGEKIDSSMDYPAIAVGLRIGSTRQVKDISIAGLKVSGITHGVFITGMKNSTISDCEATLCSDGFRFASNESGVAESFGIENLTLINCKSTLNGRSWLPPSGVVSTAPHCGFKITDIPINNLTFIDCTAENNCGFGFNYHGHEYLSLPAGFKQKTIKFINCKSMSNNIPIENLPADSIPAAGTCSGFYIGMIGVDVHDIQIMGCVSIGHFGENIYTRSLNNGANIIRGLTVDTISIGGISRVSNMRVRQTNAMFSIRDVNNFRIGNISLSDTQNKYDFVIHGINLSGEIKIFGHIDGDIPNLIYAKASVSGNSRFISEVSTLNKEKNLSSEQSIVIRVIDFEEIEAFRTRIRSVAGVVIDYGIKQEEQSVTAKVIDISHCVITGESSTNRITGGAIDLQNRSGSKTLSSNIIGNANYGIFGAANSENAVINGNNFIKNSVSFQIQNYATNKNVITANWGVVS